MVLCYEVCHFIYIFKPKLTKSEKKKQLKLQQVHPFLICMKENYW